MGLVVNLEHVNSSFSFWSEEHIGSVYEPNPEIIIEAFGDLANSFAVFAFRAAQENEVRVAHHLHVTGQINWAVQERNTGGRDCTRSH